MEAFEESQVNGGKESFLFFLFSFPLYLPLPLGLGEKML